MAFLEKGEGTGTGIRFFFSLSPDLGAPSTIAAGFLLHMSLSRNRN